MAFAEQAITAEEGGLVINAKGAAPIVLVCEHATNLVPPEFNALGLDAVGMVGICKYSPILPQNELNDWLRQKHQEQFGEDPDLFTGGGFAAGVALVEGLRRTAGDPSAEALIPAYGAFMALRLACDAPELFDVEFEWGHGLNPRLIGEIRRIVLEHFDLIMEAWNRRS